MSYEGGVGGGEEWHQVDDPPECVHQEQDQLLHPALQELLQYGVAGTRTPCDIV